MSLIKSNWSIILTARRSYLQALEILLKRLSLSLKMISIENLSDEELLCLSGKYNFKLPQNTKLKELILNLFYLDLYLNHINKIDGNMDLKKFKEMIWNQKVQNIELTKDNLHLRREETLFEIAKKQCRQGCFSVALDKCDDEAVSALEKDEIIGITDGCYFIIHDIYEEWALDKIIDREFKEADDPQIFLQNIQKNTGNSLIIRKAFGKWALNKIENEYKDIEQFIIKVLLNKSYDCWKDEVWTAVLLSDNSDEFFKQIEPYILGNQKLLKR